MIGGSVVSTYVENIREYEAVLDIHVKRTTPGGEFSQQTEKGVRFPARNDPIRPAFRLARMQFDLEADTIVLVPVAAATISISEHSA